MQQMMIMSGRIKQTPMTLFQSTKRFFHTVPKPMCGLLNSRFKERHCGSPSFTFSLQQPQQVSVITTTTLIHALKSAPRRQCFSTLKNPSRQGTNGNNILQEEVSEISSLYRLLDELLSKDDFMGMQGAEETRLHLQDVQQNLKQRKYNEALINIHKAIFCAPNGVIMARLYHWSSRLLLAFANPQKELFFNFSQWASNDLDCESDSFVAMVSHCRVLIGLNRGGELVQQVLHGLMEKAQDSPHKNNITALLMLLQGLSLNDAGITDGADHVLSAAIELCPDFSIPYVIRGILNASVEETEKGLEDLKKAIELDKSNPLPWMQRASVLIGIDPHEAFHDIEQAVELEPDNPTIFLIRGNMFASSTEDVETALEDYERCIRLNPNVPSGYFSRASVLSRYSDHAKDALDELSKVLELDDQFAPAYNLRAVIHNSQKNFDSALENVNKVIEINPHYPLIYELQGKIYLEGLGNIDTAISSFQKAIDQRSFTYESLIALGKIYMTSDPKLALQNFTEALDLEPHVFESYILRARLYFNTFKDYKAALEDFDKGIEEAVKHEVKVEANIFIDRAAALVALNENTRAIAELKETQKLQLEDAELHMCYLLMAQSYSQANKLSECLNAFELAIGINNSNALTFFSRGMVLRDLAKDSRGAIDDFSRAIGLSGSRHDPSFYYERGVTYAHIGEYTQALNDLDIAISLKNDYEEAYLERINVLCALDKYHQALKDVEHVIQLNPAPDANLFAQRGKIRFMIGSEPTLAKEDLDRALAVRPNDPEIILNRARLYLESLDDVRRGMTDLNRALEIDDRYFDAYLYRSNYFRTVTKNYNKALEDIDNCIRLHPDSSEALFERAMVFMATTCYDLAMKDLNKCIDMSPQSSTMYTARALLRLYVKSKDYESALNDCDRSLQLNPLNVDALNIRAAILCEMHNTHSALETIEASLVLDNNQVVPHVLRAYILTTLENKSEDATSDLEWLRTHNATDKLDAVVQGSIVSLFDKMF